MAPFPGMGVGGQASHLVAGDDIGMEGQRFILMEMDIYSGHRSAFSDCNASASTTIHRLTERLIHCHGILHSIAADQETSVHSKEVRQWGSPVELAGLPHAPSPGSGWPTKGEMAY